MLSQNDLIIEYAFMYYWQNDIRMSVYQKDIFQLALSGKCSFPLFSLHPASGSPSIWLTWAGFYVSFHEIPSVAPCRSCWEGLLLISSKTTRKSSQSFFQLICHKNAVSCGNWVYTQMAVAQSLCWGRKWIFPFRLIKGFGDSFKVSILARNKTTATWS